MLAKSFLHALVPSLVVTVQAVRVDAVEDFHAVTERVVHREVSRSLADSPPSVRPGLSHVTGIGKET
jgi:hypothetical protein